MSKKDKKIVAERLTDLVGRYSGSNILYQLEKEYKGLPNKLVDVEEIDDNAFLKRIKYSQKQLDILIHAYNTNSFVEPLIVRPKKDHYEVVVGRKRLHAARLSNMKQIHVIVGDFGDEETLLIMLTIARDEHHVNPIEMALICSVLSKDYRYSQSQLAKLTKISRPQVTNITRLLTLPDTVINDVARGKLQFGHARALITLPENKAIEFAEIAKKDNLNVRILEQMVRSYKNSDEHQNKRIHIREQKSGLTLSFSDEETKLEVLKYLKDKYEN